MSHRLEPCFLVAAPSLDCAFFRGAVVLLVDHRSEGSLGFIVNRPSNVRFSDVLQEMGLDVGLQSPSRFVMAGGPVSAQNGWIVFDPGRGCWPASDTIQLSSELAVSASMEALQALARDDSQLRGMMMLGYAGWGPGQLDEEIARGSWIPVDLEPRLLFETPVEQRWTKALATLGIEPGYVASTVMEA